MFCPCSVCIRLFNANGEIDMGEKSLFTIGYEGETISDFLATIEHIGIQTIIDVRDVPISRKHDLRSTLRPKEYLIYIWKVSVIRSQVE